jgi:hypothetical protein
MTVAHPREGALLQLRAKDESPDPPLTVVSPAGPGCSPQPGPVFIHSESTPRRSSGEISPCDVGADKAWRVFHVDHVLKTKMRTTGNAALCGVGQKKFLYL